MSKRSEVTDIPSLSSAPDYREYFAEKVKLDDHIGRPIILDEVYITEGDKGEYAVFIGRFDPDGDPITFSCSGAKVVEWFKAHNFEGYLPVWATFEKAGRMWLVS